MNMGNVNVVSVGVVAVLVGTAVLAAMVRYDLAPSGHLQKGGQWLLATALGTGIIAFIFKLTLIVAIANLPEILIDPVIAREKAPPPSRRADPLLGVPQTPRYRWQPLPPRLAEASAHTVSWSGRIWKPLPEQAPSPAGNPTTPTRVALGKRLFFDRALSRDGTLSCAGCHDVEGGSGADGRATSLGIGGQVGSRNAPTVWNAAFQSVLFWDGRADSLETQAKGPLINPVEMGMPSLDAVVDRVKANPAYYGPFQAAFGEGATITIDRIAAAIAAYERTLITPDAPYDRFVRGDLQALSPAQLRGMGLFQSLGCVNCHSGPNFSAASVFDGKAPRRLFPTFPTPYEERYGLTRDSGASPAGSGRGVWRIPSLRNVALTAPYFHNGSVKSLREAVRIMASVQLGRTGPFLIWSDRSKTLSELGRPTLSEREVGDIVAFLHALSSASLVARINNRMKKS